MDDTELLKIFWTEVREYVENLNANVMALEMSQPNDDAGAFVERLRELNRVAHSMKGAARAVGVRPIEQLGYYMEEVFEASLKRGLALTTEVCDILYDAIDLLQTAASGEEVPPDAVDEVISSMNALIQESGTSPYLDESEESDKSPEPPPTRIRQSDTYPAIGAPPTSNGDARHTPDDDEESVTSTIEVEAVPSAPETPMAPERAAEIPTRPNYNTMTVLMRPVEDTVRVDVEKLDRLMAESSELLMARLQSEERKNQVDQLRRLNGRWAKDWRAIRATYVRLARLLQTDEASEELRNLLEFLETNQRYLQESTRLTNALSGAMTSDNMRLFALTDELQDSISSLRLVPFETILGTLQRIMRDAARETGKEAYLDVVGGSTEIDRTVLEHLKDPLMHLIRNAVDHGIEPAQEREAKGKPPMGWVYLNIETRGSEIIIHVGDDGRGIDVQRVRENAVKKGIITAHAAANMDDEEARALIFHPGLTTRDSVTAISGRGVGMDVVRERVENLRGRISLSSNPDMGTITTISVPVSLTRIRSIMAQVGSEQYALPSLSVQRMERISRDEIFMAEGRPVIRMGERTLPLVSLADMLDITVSRQEDPSSIRIMVLNAADRQVAFEVDELTSERELVLKPLGPELIATRYISGAALLGSGEVVLVLDANDLVRGATGTNLPSREHRVSVSRTTPDEPPPRLRVLVADDSITTRTLEKNILETAGCDVRVAIDGVQAWEELSNHEFDVVISDVEMPRMDGLALTRRIKENPTTKHIPVILLTSLNKPEHREAGLTAGANAYLVKSRFDQDELLRTIQSVL